MDPKIYQAYLDILREELVPAMGCTEPIAIAYAGAVARRALGRRPEKTVLTVSGNIIKNVKSVIVPNTGGRKGLRTAVAAGICCGDPDRELQVIADVSAAQLADMDDFLARTDISIEKSDANCPFDIRLTLRAGEDEVYLRIIAHHTNLVTLRRNGEMLIDRPYTDELTQTPENRSLLSVENIVAFADALDPEDVRDLLQRQMEYNLAIAEEGLRNDYGANIGSILLRSYGDSVQNRAKAWAAAASDARMNGCELPVIINSGSGNQGITASVPVVIYGRELGVSEEKLLRALALSNLITIHLKSGIGSLSAYCGATSAGCGAGAGICYLYGGRLDEIAHTVVNALAINSGMLCDGAKASCAAKIASAVEAGLLGMQMYMHDSQFYGGDGIVVKGVENTIRTVSTIAREGMRRTDDEIIGIMMKN